MTLRAGLLLSTDAGVVFLAAPIAQRVVALGPVTPVTGLVRPAEGVAICEGRVVTVVTLAEAGAGGRAAVLCEVRGDIIAIAGGEILSAGLYGPASRGDGVEHQGRDVPELDIASLYAEIEAGMQSARALRHARRSVDSIRARSMPPASAAPRATPSEQPPSAPPRSR